MEYIITLANIISVYYAAKNNVLTWWFGIIATALTSVLFYNKMMPMSCIFNVYSTICAIIAICYWKKNPCENDNEVIFEGYLLSLLIFFGTSTLFLFLNNYAFNIDFNIADVFGTSLAVVATYLLVKRNVLSWVYWVISDIVYIGYGWVNNDIEIFIIYGVLLILAIYGLWRNIELYYKNLYNL